MKTHSKALKGRHMIARGEAPGTGTQPPHPSPAPPSEATEHIGELRALDAWLLENIFGGALALTGKTNPLPHYTTEPADNRLVLEKCFERLGGTLIGICKLGDIYCVCVPGSDGTLLEIIKAPTLELAICLFAKHLTSGRPWPVLSIHG